MPDGDQPQAPAPVPFDIAGARAAGYSDGEIANYVGGIANFNTDGARKAGYQDDEIINQLAVQPPPPLPSSASGAFARSATEQVLPTAGGMASAGMGAATGAALGAMIPGLGETGIGEAIGGIGGGLYGFFAGAQAVEAVQHGIINMLPTSVQRAIGQDPEQREADEEQHPYASMVGGLAPSLLVLRPGAVEKAAQDAPALAKVMANPIAARAFGAGVNTSLEAIQEARQDDGYDPTKLAISAASGALLNRETGLGQRLSGAGPAAIGRLLDPLSRPNVQPRAADVTPPADVLGATDIDSAINAAKQVSSTTSGDEGAPPPAGTAPGGPAPPDTGGPGTPIDAHAEAFDMERGDNPDINQAALLRMFANTAAGSVEATPDGGYQFRRDDGVTHPIETWNPNEGPAAQTEIKTAANDAATTKRMTDNGFTFDQDAGTWVKPASTISADTADTLRQHYAQAGVHVVFYKDDPGIPFDGAVDPKQPNVLFLSNDPQRNIAQVASHEFTHVLSATTLPDGTNLGDLLNQQVAAGITSAGRKYATKMFGPTAPTRDQFPAGPQGTTDHAAAVSSHLISELGADIGGEAPKFQTFLPRVVDAIQARWGGTVAGDVLGKLVGGLQTAMTNIRSFFGETGTRSQNWVTNLGEIHDTLAKMYAQRFGSPIEREQAAVAAMKDRAERDRLANAPAPESAPPEPAAAPPEPASAPAPESAPPPSSTGLVELGNAGKAIGDNLRVHLWTRIEAGHTRETDNGPQSNLLILAKRVRDAGGLRTREQFDDFVTAVSPHLEDRTPGWQQRLNDAGRAFVPAPEPASAPVKAEPGATRQNPTQPDTTAAAPSWEATRDGLHARALQLRRWLAELGEQRPPETEGDTTGMAKVRAELEATANAHAALRAEQEGIAQRWEDIGNPGMASALRAGAAQPWLNREGVDFNHAKLAAEIAKREAGAPKPAEKFSLAEFMQSGTKNDKAALQTIEAIGSPEARALVPRVQAAAQSMTDRMNALGFTRAEAGQSPRPNDPRTQARDYQGRLSSLLGSFTRFANADVARAKGYKNATEANWTASLRELNDALEAAGGERVPEPAPAPAPEPRAEPVGTRAEQILAELDARQAPDIEYRSAFSTGSRTPLRAGQTWRQRLLDRIATEKAASEPAAPSSVSDRPRPVDGWVEMGKNHLGETLYENKDGARSIVTNGVRRTEPVEVRPVRDEATGRVTYETVIRSRPTKADEYQIAQWHPGFGNAEPEYKAPAPREPAVEPDRNAMPPAPADPAQGENWWKHELTDAGRQMALEAAGLKALPTTAWHHLSLAQRARLLGANRAMPAKRPGAAAPTEHPGLVLTSLETGKTTHIQPPGTVPPAPAANAAADQFRRHYADPANSLAGMRTNQHLKPVADYADWLGSLSDSDWAKIGDQFKRSDNPFVNAASIDEKASRAKLESILAVPPPQVTVADIGTKVRPTKESGLDQEKNAGTISHVQTTDAGTKISVDGGPHFSASDFERAEPPPPPPQRPPNPEAPTADAIHAKIIARLHADAGLQAHIASVAGNATTGALARVRTAYGAALGKMLSDLAERDPAALTKFAAAADELRSRPIDAATVREATAPAPNLPPGYGANNKFFTADAAEKALATLREKLARFNVGVDPELLAAGLYRAGFHVEAGARRFVDYAQRMVAELGNGVRPFLANFYNSVRDYPGFDNAGMDDAATVKRLHEAPQESAAPAPAPANQSWAPEVKVEGKWSRNAVRFATEAEAKASAAELHSRWMLSEEHRATEATEPPNYRWANGKLEKIEAPSESLVPAPPPHPEPPPVAPEAKAANADHGLAERIARRLEEPMAEGVAPLSARELQTLAESYYGGTLASGAYSRDRLYDAIELGVNRFIQRNPERFNPAVDAPIAERTARDLAAMKDSLPTQTVRAGEKDAYQQFSTPPDYAYAANWIANLRPTDHVLEPSAGIGGLIVHAMNGGVRETTVNELSDKRRGMISALNPTRVTGEDAAQLHNILPENVRPTVVVMNPPFSRAAERMGGRMVLDEGAKHIEQALARLEPGGRLVAIVGDGMKPEGTPRAPGDDGRRGGTGKAFTPWWAKIGAEYDVRANVGVERTIYTKYGTSFPTRLLVIDKTPPSGRPLVTGQARDAAELIGLLQGVRNDRSTDERVAGQPGSPEVAGGGKGVAGPGDQLPSPTGVVGPGQTSGVRPGANPPEPAGTTQPGVRGGRPGGVGTRGGRPRDPLVSIEPEPGPGGTGGQPGGPTGAIDDANGGGAGGSGGGVRPDGSGERDEPGLTPAPEEILATENAVSEPGAKELNESVYEAYAPQRAKIAGAQPHPSALVQSAAMATVLPPPTDYVPRIPAALVKSGALSDAQLEAILYAGHAHSDMMDGGPPRAPGAVGPVITSRRRGFFIGDGCVAAGTRIFDPTTGKHTAIENLVGREHTVLALTPDGFVPAKATITFRKGVADLYRVTLDDGRAITVTGQHRFLTPLGWAKIDDGLSAGAVLASAAGPHVLPPTTFSTRGLDEPRCSQRPQDCLDGCSVDRRPHDAQPQSAAGSGLASLPSRADAPAHSPASSRSDGLDVSGVRSPPFRAARHHSKSSSVPGVSRALASISEITPAGSVQLSALRHQGGRLSDEGQAPLLQLAGSTRPSQAVPASGWSGTSIEAEYPACVADTRPSAGSRHAGPQAPCCASPLDTLSRFDPMSLLTETHAAFSSIYYSRWNRVAAIEFVRRDEFFDMYVPGPESYVAEGVVNHNTGVGKGREIAGIILDNFQQGRTKAVWVSEKRPLINDAKRDWNGMGQPGTDIIDHGKLKPGDAIQATKGILFTSYDTLKAGEKTALTGGFKVGTRVTWHADANDLSITETGTVESGPTKGKYPGWVIKMANGKTETIGDQYLWKENTDPTTPGSLKAGAAGKTRVQQVVDWVGKDFDGVIAFDEAHAMGNSADTRGSRGVKKAALKALAGMELQNQLPNARVVYVSATGATEVSNLGFADRLGLWGENTAFPTKEDFIGQVSSGGMAGMELVARDMKALGHYIARNLSYDGVEYDRIEHPLTLDQRHLYDKMAEAWQLVLRHFDAALVTTGATEDGATKNSKAKSNARSAFWGAHQRFFNQIITSMQMPSVIRAVETDIKEGRQAVLQLVNTGAAAQERALEKARSEDDNDLEDLDMSPLDQLLQMVEKSYPVQQMEDYADENGNIRSRPAVDSEGNPVINKELVARRDLLLKQLASLDVPDGPLEILLNHFGTDAVAEVTGRKQRVVRKPDEAGNMKTGVEQRGIGSNVADAADFQNRKKKILVFSEAGGTGRSYHDDADIARALGSSARRSHYLIQPGWRADKAMQGFGRDHRTNQASAPIFHLVTTDLKGQKRFIASIARRLGQLGALTKGERRAADQGMFSMRDNLESTEAKLGLRQFFMDVHAGTIDGVTMDDLEKTMGLNLRDDSGALARDLPEMTQFLNRVLSLTYEHQNRVFTEFSDRLDLAIDRAAAAGTLDTGTETYQADKISKISEQTVYTDKRSGAETKHVHLNAQNRNEPADFDDIMTGQYKTGGAKPDSFAQNIQSGRVFAVTTAGNYTDEDGRVIPQVRLTSPIDYQLVDREKVNRDRWKLLTPQEARPLWDQQVATTPEYRNSALHIITGAVLPIWDRLGGNPKIYRLQTDTGERMLGRVIPIRMLDATLKSLGAEGVKVTATPAEVAQQVLNGGTARLGNGWVIKRSLVAGEPRLEIAGPDYRFDDELERVGVFSERIAYKTRYFIPTEPAAAVAAIEGITKSRPITALEGGTQFSPRMQFSPRVRDEEDAPPFFSALTRGVEGLKQDRATPGQWIASIKNMAGVKAEERAWSGVEDWLGRQPKSVTKPELLDYLRANEVRLGEVTKGGDPYDSPSPPEPRYANYVTPGGKNYREMLLTLPPKAIEPQIGAPQPFGGDGEAMADGRHRVSGVMEYPVTVPGGADGRITYWPKTFDWRGQEGPPKWIVWTTDIQGAKMDSLEAARDYIVQSYNRTNLRGAPRRTDTYPSSHWDEPNVLAHIRFDDRTDAAGRHVLHVAEIQSDWHQEGRKHGYQEGVPPDRYYIRDQDGYARGDWATRAEAQAYLDNPPVFLDRERSSIQTQAGLSTGVPNAPFKTTWPELAFKRVLRHAAENGYDRVTWDTGETNADRYSLTKTIAEIHYGVAGDMKGVLEASDHYGNTVVNKKLKNDAELADYVGQETADRLLTHPTSTRDDKDAAWHVLSGLDLKSGGEGMKGFYDKILPTVANKLGKKFGASVREGEVKNDQEHAWNGGVTTPVHAIDVTPAMRESVMRGQPLFSPRITGAQRETDAYTPEEKQAFANVGRITNEPTWRERWDNATKDLGRRFIQAVLDPYIAVKADDPAGYIALRNANTSSGALLRFMTDGTLKFDGSTYAMADRNGGVEHNLIRPLHGEENRFLWWVAANRAERLSEQDRENLWSADDIATLKGLNRGSVPFDYTLPGGQVTRSREAIYLDSLRKLDGFNRNVMDLAEQSGLISPEAASALVQNPFYVPFYRAAEDSGGRFSGAVSSGFVKQYAFKSLKGGTEKLNHDLWGNAIGNWSHMIDASIRNRAAAGVLDTGVTNGAVIERTPEEVAYLSKKDKESVVWVMNNGRRQLFQVTDPMLYTAISALDFTGYRGGFFNAMTKFKTIYTMGVTSDPRFMLRVAIKDAEQAIALSPLSFNFVKNIVQGFKMGDLPGTLSNVARAVAGQETRRLNLSDEAANAMAGGATMHLGAGHDTGARKINLDTMLDNPGAISRFWSRVSKVAASYKELTGQGEDVQRLAVYHQLRAQGVPHDEAAFAGRDIEDFTLRGAAPIVRAITQTVPFLNAMLQGLYKVGRSAADADRNVTVAVGKRIAASATRRVATVLAATTVLTLALDAIYQDDEDYKKRTDADRNSNFWFKVGQTQFRIPMGFEIAALSRIAANGVEAIVGGSEMTGRRFINNVGSILSNNLYMSPVPQAVAPIVDVYANKGSGGAPIVPRGLDKLQSQEQYTPASTMLARGLSSAGSSAARAIAGPQAQFWAPVQIDYLANAYFGWLGTTVTNMADLAVRGADQAQAAVRGTKPMEPIRPDHDMWNFATGGVISSEPTPQSRYVDMLYQQADAASRAYSTYHDMIGRGQVDQARDFYAGNKDLIAANTRMQDVTRNETVLSHQIRRVEDSPTLTADQKHDQILKYNAMRNKAAEQIFRPHGP